MKPNSTLQEQQASKAWAAWLREKKCEKKGKKWHRVDTTSPHTMFIWWFLSPLKPPLSPRLFVVASKGTPSSWCRRCLLICSPRLMVWWNWPLHSGSELESSKLMQNGRFTKESQEGMEHLRNPSTTNNFNEGLWHGLAGESLQKKIIQLTQMKFPRATGHDGNKKCGHYTTFTAPTLTTTLPRTPRNLARKPQPPLWG